ncbi:hypothetical protein SARC_11021 [Sphaeroforma arctica JP610]|uniref:UspA domain-containing protein n=1 Tax=Sphaeroforma arctica JP610 TaxID=667725 RepID=A0A0L0FI71_9EUKA|nr:hypothetical protein SARC_11021 [Sphaeroforma arctica JP610]KNC76479.1 hypothetical protein SARC_11021 [Sphaeroforma arctica JP610]|eukprot:XP_014150381.1 hypothetical protein SARC_11021 [Sphaeroforma arctica JP610]
MAPRTIVVAVNNSEGGVYAVEWAFKDFVRPTDNVILVNVVDTYTHYIPNFGTTVTFDMATNHVQKEVVENAQTLLAYLAKQMSMRPGQIETKVIAGDARDVMVELTEEQDIDVVILGTSNKTLLRRKLVGSVGSYLVEHCKCSVIIAKQKP